MVDCSKQTGEEVVGVSMVWRNYQRGGKAGVKRMPGNRFEEQVAWASVASWSDCARGQLRLGIVVAPGTV